MTVRLLDAVASQLTTMKAAALKDAIRLSDGRTVAAEVICTHQSPVDGVSHGEIAAAMGADIIVLDQYDSINPRISGAPDWALQDSAPLAAYQKLLGRPVGVNMIVAEENQGAFLGGRLVTRANVDRAVQHGVKVIFLYMRPQIGGTHAQMVEHARLIKSTHVDSVMLIGVPTFSKPAPRNPDAIAAYQQEVSDLLAAGCEGIGLPMPGTKSGWTVEAASAIVDDIHQHNGLAWLFITASVEGAPQEVMYQLALLAKSIGADAYRIDEAGLAGMPSPENILAFSLAIRGRQHTFRRMAASVLR